MKRSLPVLICLSVCLSVHGQAAPSDDKDSSLDAAKQDLKNLSATVHSRELQNKSSAIGGTALPAIDGLGEQPAATGKPRPDGASSTWLLDAMQQVDLEKTGKDPQKDPKALAGQNVPAVKNAVDPFAHYLEQWLSPKDYDLLFPDAKKTAENGTAFFSEQKQREDRPGFDEPFTTPMTTFAAPAKNPYIEDVEPQPASSIQGAATPIPVYSAKTPASLVTPANPLPQAEPTQAAPVAVPAAPRPPTAPIVDDRKYFPQLRRF